MPKISAIIITKNEEKNIERCLASLIDIVDEIVVIDSLSTDQTKEICLSFQTQVTLQFVERPFEGYSATKNYGNGLAKHPYLLSIDADEVVSEELKASIWAEKETMAFEAYTFNRKTNYVGKWVKHCGWYPDTRKRLWKNGIGQWQGIIHENLILETKKVGHLEGDLLHYSYESIDDHLNRINRYTDLIAEDKLSKGKKGSVFHLLFSPMAQFIKTYFFQLGFLDGYTGFVISIMAAYYAFLKYAKLRALRRSPGGS